jgi:hypothetical protein
MTVKLKLWCRRWSSWGGGCGMQLAQPFNPPTRTSPLHILSLDAPHLPYILHLQTPHISHLYIIDAPHLPAPQGARPAGPRRDSRGDSDGDARSRHAPGLPRWPLLRNGHCCVAPAALSGAGFCGGTHRPRQPAGASERRGELLSTFYPPAAHYLCCTSCGGLLYCLHCW